MDADMDKLFMKAKTGDVEAFDALIVVYEKLIYNITYKYFLNEWDAKDISQEILIKIYKHLRQCRDIGSFKSWICRIAVNSCLDELRKRTNTERIDSDETLTEIQDNRYNPEQCLSKAETLEEILSALKKLPEESKRLIILRDINGMSYNELSVHTETPIGTIKSKLSRARSNLKRMLLNKNL